MTHFLFASMSLLSSISMASEPLVLRDPSNEDTEIEDDEETEEYQVPNAPLVRLPRQARLEDDYSDVRVLLGLEVSPLPENFNVGRRNAVSSQGIRQQLFSDQF